jgi:hypothetical protein
VSAPTRRGDQPDTCGRHHRRHGQPTRGHAAGADRARGPPHPRSHPLLALLQRSALLRADIRGGHPGPVLDLHLRLLAAGSGVPIADAAVYLHQ